MPKKKRTAIPIISEAELKDIIASVEMECGPFTADEIADLRRVQRGEITTTESIAAIKAEIRAKQQRGTDK